MMHFTPDEYPDDEQPVVRMTYGEWIAATETIDVNLYSDYLRQLTVDHMTLPFMTDEPDYDPGDTQPMPALFEDEDESTP